jgi:hypothetical protein
MTGTDLCVNKPHKSRSYLNHLVISREEYWLKNFGNRVLRKVFGPNREEVTGGRKKIT